MSQCRILIQEVNTRIGTIKQLRHFVHSVFFWGWTVVEDGIWFSGCSNRGCEGGERLGGHEIIALKRRLDCDSGMKDTICKQ